MAEPLLLLDNVAKRFGSREVLRGVSFEVRRGETLCVLGPSGSGKSTVLKIAIGALPPTAGRVVLDGAELTAMSERARNHARSRFGVLFQGAALLQSLTVGENVALPLRQHTRLPRAAVATIVKLKLEQVGLRDAEHLLPAELSGGMQKRAGLARALALDPDLVFYDEPSAGLDPVAVSAIDDLMNALRDRTGITSVVVTHVLASVERIADRVVFLHEGRILAAGSLAEIRDAPDPIVQQFLSGSIEGPLTVGQARTEFYADLLNL
ncbi:MAG: ABC transporter ATP-binding protein [Planctomycetes bacterium]|nr:ABC transporter ATP-binding protein [Planctomycetota bacterium]